MPPTARLFSGLLAELQRGGFPIGVDHHLRIAQLMGNLGGSCPPASLKTLLCPLIATDPEEQKRFYAVFDQHYALHLATPVDAGQSVPRAAENDKADGSRRKKVVHFSLAAAIVVLGVGATLFHHLGAPSSDLTPTPPCDSIPVRGAAGVKSCPQPAADTLPDTAATPGAVAPAGLVLVSSKPVHTWYEQFSQAVAAGWASVPLVIVGLSEVLRRRRQRTGRESAKSKGPYHWTIRAPLAPPWYRGSDFAQAVRLLRAREQSGNLRLDLERSIAATVEEGGYPTWRFRSDTRPPEYLFLIDRAAQRDHQAKYYASLVQGLDDEGVFLEQWFFDRDPRTCTADSTKPSTSLRELGRLRPGSRLVMFADGDSLVDPVSGELAQWTSELEAWKDRAILTPRPSTGWGVVEMRFLAERLLVRPGTLEGLKAAGYDFSPDTGASRRDWVGRSSDVEVPDVTSPGDLDQLRTALGSDLYRWLCACAIYPEVHWDLTVYLGRLVSGTTPLVTERNLLALARLPWFRVGTIPDRFRERLIADLDPAVRQTVHQALSELLEQHPPAEGSFAAERHAENLAIQQLGAAQTQAQRRELRPRLQALAPERLIHEAEIAGLEPTLPRSRLAKLIPRQWWSWLFSDGDPLYGFKLGARATVAGCLGVLAWQTTPRPVASRGPFYFAPDRVTLTGGGPGISLSIKADSLAGEGITVEDTTVGAIDRPGHLQARRVGSTRLRAVRLGDTAWARIAVVDRAASAGVFAIVAAKQEILLGEASQLEALSRDPFGTIPQDAIKWSSSNPSIAAVSSEGIVTGRSAGTARISASSGVKGVAAAGFTLRVANRRAGPRDTLQEPLLFGSGAPTISGSIGQMLSRKAGVLRDYPSIRILATGEVPGDPEQVGDYPGRPMAGLVKDYLTGSGGGIDPARIEVREGKQIVEGFSADSTSRITIPRVVITVVGGAFEKAADSTLPLRIVPVAPSLSVGDSLQLRVQDARSRAIEWQSSNPRVANVSRTGMLRALLPGIARISVRDGSRVASESVRVTALRDSVPPRDSFAAVQQENPVQSTLARFEEQARATLRLADEVSQLPITWGDTADFRQAAPYGGVYGFVSSKRLAALWPQGPVNIQRERSSEFDVEAHLQRNSTKVLGFVSKDDLSRMETTKDQAPRLSLALHPSMIQQCLVSVNLDRFASSVNVEQDAGGNLVLSVVQPKPRMIEISPTPLCYEPPGSARK